MEREEYLVSLRKQRRYCECPELNDFFEQKRNARSLEAECIKFNSETDFETLRKDDLAFYEKYKSRINEFDESVNRYLSMMNQLVEQGKLKLRAHKKSGHLWSSEEISSDEVPILVRRLKLENVIFAVHCYKCGIQVDDVKF